MDATLSRVWDQTHGKVVRSGAMPRRTPPARAGIALAELARTERYALPVAILRLALTPRRWEPWNSFNEHRAYPSPRAAWLVDVSVVDGDRRRLVDPVRDRLTGTPEEPATALTTRPGAGREPVTLALTTHPERLPAGYANLAEVLSWLEAGHVAGVLAESAAAYGWRVDTELTGPDGQLTVVLHPDDDVDTDAGGAGLDRAARVRVARERFAAHRSSGLGPRGLNADPRPLPEGTLTMLATAAHRPPAGSPARWAGLRHRAVAARITGVTGGLHVVDGGRTSLLTAGTAMDAVQDAFSYPRDKLDVAGMNVGWVITGEVASAVRTGSLGVTVGGATAYRRLLVAAGAVAQHVGSAAATAGLFCRPARSVHEAHLEAAVAAPGSEDFLYLLLIGRSRPRDFAYDLIPPEVLP